MYVFRQKWPTRMIYQEPNRILKERKRRKDVKLIGHPLHWSCQDSSPGHWEQWSLGSRWTPAHSKSGHCSTAGALLHSHQQQSALVKKNVCFRVQEGLLTQAVELHSNKIKWQEAALQIVQRSHLARLERSHLAGTFRTTNYGMIVLTAAPGELQCSIC